MSLFFGNENERILPITLRKTQVKLCQRQSQFMRSRESGSSPGPIPAGAGSPAEAPGALKAPGAYFLDNLSIPVD